MSEKGTTPPPAPPAERPAPNGPAAPRIDEVDALRGFALLGILMANVMVVSTLVSIRIDDDSLFVPFTGPVDAAVWTVVTSLFLGKFFLLFSFLFGYSFTLQLEAVKRAGVPALPCLLRRCAALFALGAVHAALLWFGDILTLYALLCVVLVVLRNTRPAITAALGCCVLAALSADKLWTLGLFPTGGSDLVWFFDATRDAGFLGGFHDTLHTQLDVGPRFALEVIWPGQGPQALALFLFGFAAGKRRLLTDTDALRPWLGRVQVAGLLVGGPVAVWAAIAERYDTGLPALLEAVVPITDTLVTAFYIATVVRLCRGRAGRRVITALAPAGRMAATNYVAQSAVFMVLYTGYGFALADDVPALGIVALAALTYAAQLAASAWWLRRHPHGPVEWALRAATYARRPRWRSS
ncbi:DUF418 domain-containing protein [Streptomyces acidiscabies]|uniref:DUF418 domain-containing protein n=1 Tax=Streptomyces acidiscabies TaxID=42234 RepID=A0AAP6BEW5_9ACTN|nr:DUF418 domain-containing protein [Streptomyces acidiscabies]MBZ3913561.1 DUF418 domain-containing protein [Streptomyces acidiscabies]MDX2963398.1 DUF418 domain-containing protein [Streptomyces acidiscabies]MDX3023132.1 DUF418 domain-containing protein [Streptomyces acidiscabies]MDX3792724.1 DUF418 domain-containing protein [Streptomyces acidiscabies]